MPAVFVHGVPETAALWEPVLTALDRSGASALSLPGFGSGRPADFGATKDEYVAWLIEELAAIGEPVDLVGHDWGGAFTIRLVSLRSDLVRSWASDAVYVYDKAYEWHDFAKLWQRPGAGEDWLKQQMETPLEERAEQLASLGVPQSYATQVAGWLDETMGTTILDLYRSAIDVAGDWGAELPSITAPGLAIHATADPFADGDLVSRQAKRLDTEVTMLDGLGHWWMLQDPMLAASRLKTFWTSVGAT